MAPFCGNLGKWQIFKILGKLFSFSKKLKEMQLNLLGELTTPHPHTLPAPPIACHWYSLASFACRPDGPGLEVSVFEEPGRDSLGFDKLTLGLKRAVHSNLDDPLPAALACSLSRVLRRGEGLEAERERRALVWSLPCLTLAPCVAPPLLLLSLPLLMVITVAVVPPPVEELE